MRNLLRIAGIIGLVAPVFCYVCILLAILSFPAFSWVNNALSDLGIQNGVTPIIFNSGLIISGLLFIIFATGIFIFLGKNPLTNVGVAIFILSCIALIGIGIFNENFSPEHYAFSVAFFTLFPISMLTLVGAFWKKGYRNLSLLTLGSALAAATTWVLQLTIHYVSNVAIPEFISGLFGAFWVMTISYLMLKNSFESS